MFPIFFPIPIGVGGGSLGEPSRRQIVIGWIVYLIEIGIVARIVWKFRNHDDVIFFIFGSYVGVLGVAIACLGICMFAETFRLHKIEESSWAAVGASFGAVITGIAVGIISVGAWAIM